MRTPSSRSLETADGARSGGFDQAELGQRSYAVVQADLLHDPSVRHLQHRGARELHLAAGRGREGANEEIFEGRPGVAPAAFPLADDVVTLRNQVRRTPEIEIRERGTEIDH